MRPRCPSCGHHFGLFSEPKLKSWNRDPVNCYVCSACGAELVIVGGLVKQLRQLAFWAIASVLVVIAEWGAYRFVPSPYADIAFLVAGIAIVCVAITTVALSFELRGPTKRSNFG